MGSCNKSAVFDSARVRPIARRHFAGSTEINMRRDSRDRRPAKSIATPLLMGDPTPERLAAMIITTTKRQKRTIPMTFRELRQQEYSHA